MSRKTYHVRGMDLVHDGERYPEGSTIELTAEQAAEKRRWLEPVLPDTRPMPTKAAKGDNQSADDKAMTNGDADKADDKGQSAEQGEGDKQ